MSLQEYVKWRYRRSRFFHEAIVCIMVVNTLVLIMRIVRIPESLLLEDESVVPASIIIQKSNISSMRKQYSTRCAPWLKVRSNLFLMFLSNNFC